MRLTHPPASAHDSGLEPFCRQTFRSGRTEEQGNGQHGLFHEAQRMCGITWLPSSAISRKPGMVRDAKPCGHKARTITWPGGITFRGNGAIYFEKSNDGGTELEKKEKIDLDCGRFLRAGYFPRFQGELDLTWFDKTPGNRESIFKNQWTAGIRGRRRRDSRKLR